MPIFDKVYLEHVRSVLSQSMHAPHAPTTQSWTYRKRASDVARQADASSDIEEQINLLKLALQWLQLAENEEFMALHHQRANDN
jgi:hypothetical protein